MLQDTGNAWINTEYEAKAPQEDDYVLMYMGPDVLVNENEDLVTYKEWKEKGGANQDLVRVFSIAGKDFYMMIDSTEKMEQSFKRVGNARLRTIAPSWLRLASITGVHLKSWYNAHHFCGRCGGKMYPDDKELALRCGCEDCRNVIYPSIFPAVIVAIRNQDKILLTYSSVRKNPVYALVTGYMSVGETFEKTARREVKEETGLDIKNLTYYGNQPWGYSGAQMIGFWADLDGSDEVVVQKSELKEAKWYSREEIPPILEEDPLDLTHYMIELFRNGKDPR